MFVPNLGVNLLPVSRLCQAGLNFVGNQNKLFLNLRNKVIVEARMNQGIYAVTHIAQGYEETAFNSVLNNKSNDNFSSVSLGQISHEEAICKNKKKR